MLCKPLGLIIQRTIHLIQQNLEKVTQHFNHFSHDLMSRTSYKLLCVFSLHLPNLFSTFNENSTKIQVKCKTKCFISFFLLLHI